MIAVLGVDPGINATGWAIAACRYPLEEWSPPKVVRLGVLRPPSKGAVLGIVAQEIGEGLRAELQKYFALAHPILTVAIELMQVYQGAKQRGRQSDLIALAVVAGAVIGIIGPALTALIEPGNWQSQGGYAKDKVIRHRRLLRSGVVLPDALEGLKAGTIPSLRHNALDAAGIAMWGIERQLLGLDAERQQGQV